MNSENKRYFKDLSHKSENFAFKNFFTATLNDHLWVEAVVNMKWTNALWGTESRILCSSGVGTVKYLKDIFELDVLDKCFVILRFTWL